MPSGQRRTAGTQGANSADFKNDFSQVVFNAQLENKQAALTALLVNLKRKEKAENFKIEWMEDILSPEIVTVDTSLGAGATSLTVNEAYTGYMAVGTLLYCTETGETMQVTVINSTTNVTVTRDYGSFLSATPALTANSVIVIESTPIAEGSSSPDSISTNKAESHNLTQIFKTPFSVSNTLNAVKTWTGDKALTYQEKKALIDHKKMINKAIWFGIRNTVTSGADVTRTMGGVIQHLQFNEVAIAAPGVLTLKHFDQLGEKVFENGSGVRHVFGSLSMMSALDGITRDFKRIDANSKTTFGMKMGKLETNKGDFVFVPEPNIFRGDTGEKMVALDLDLLKYRYLDGRDTKLEKNIQDNDVDGVKHQFITECSLEFKGYGIGNTYAAYGYANRAPHGEITGYSSY